MSAAERLTASCSSASFTSRSRSTAPVVATGGAGAAAARRSCWATVIWALSKPIALRAGRELGEVRAGGLHHVALDLAHLHVRLERSGPLGVAEVGEEGRAVGADEDDAVRPPEPRQVADVGPRRDEEGVDAERVEPLTERGQADGVAHRVAARRSRASW